MSKTKFTELPVSITTDYEHQSGDEFEVVRQRVEKAGFYVRTIFNSIKTAARVHEDEAAQASYELGLFCADLIHFAEIGDGIGETLFAASSDLTDFQPETELNEIEKPIATVKVSDAKIEPLPPRQSAEIASLALQLSAVLNNQNLPIEIYNGVMDCVGEIYNKGDNEILNKFESSPEYLKALLLAYAKREVSH